MDKFKEELFIKSGFNSADISKTFFNYINNFGVISLENGKEINLKSNSDTEVGLVIYSGMCDISIYGKTYKAIGGRKSVFDGLPAGIYIPIGTEYTIRSYDSVEIGVCSAKCDTKSEFAIIYPEDIQVMQVGKENWHREVRIIIGKNSPSINLIVGETINPPGNWSGTPPHRHENMNLPNESVHEELYYFKTNRPEGFGIQRIYSPEKYINELIFLKNGTITFMPEGYHQIVAGPGYILYYLFFLAGEGKVLAGFVDPQHRWLIS
ncbi:MAG: 5-deoxy-glucuronate isomerase [Candidatus Omnitrophota bacterium]|nr:5-deoxy-glucuronate isomerase [Candidatus Omnitrophota bacterium]